MPFFWDPTMIILIPALILSFWAQYRTRSTFNKYSKIASSRGITGEEAASQILSSYGVNYITIKPVAGSLTDNYDPKNKVLNLSQPVYHSTSIAAIGVAAHEAGHAIQHARGYGPISIRNAIVPIANFTSPMGFVLFFIGLIFSLPFLIKIGIIFFSIVVVFHLVTLPVELDASSRALKVLKTGLYLTAGELTGARAVLSAAAMTYVAAALMALLNLARMLLLSRSRD